MGTFLLGTAWRRLFVRGILFVGMSLLVRGRFFPRRGCVFRASLFFRVRGILPLRRTRWTRHLGTWCWSHTRLGFRPGRVVLRFVLGAWSRGAGSWWNWAILRA